MPQKTRTAKRKYKTKTKTTHLRKIFHRTPTPYPFSSVSSVSPRTDQVNGSITTSSSMMKAVSRDGEHWHVDTDVNGVKKHANLTNSQIMNILAYPAAKQDLKTRLLQEFRNIPEPPHQPQVIAQNFGVPIIRMVGSIQEPKVEYIYKKGCSNKPVMLNKLSPLHEAKIVPESSEEPIHLVPMSMSRVSSRVEGKKIKMKKKVVRKTKMKTKSKSNKRNRN
jgi:hypothetical protein